METAGLNLPQGLKFPDAHAHTPICQTYTQTHTYAIKVRHSKPRFFQFAHKGNRVCLCHFPSQTSASLPCSRAAERAAHTEPPCVSAFVMTTHSHLYTQCDVQEKPLLGAGGICNFPSVHSNCSMDSQTQRRLAVVRMHAWVRVEERAEELG